MNYCVFLKFPGWEGRRRDRSDLVRPDLALFPDVSRQGVEGNCGSKHLRAFSGLLVPLNAADRGKVRS